MLFLVILMETLSLSVMLLMYGLKVFVSIEVLVYK